MARGRSARYGIQTMPSRLLALLLLSALGCSKGVGLGDTGATSTLPIGCDDGAPPDDYVAGIARKTADQVYTLTMSSADPAPPDVGKNRWTVQTSPSAAGAVRVRPWMPLHGHGTSPEWYEATASGADWVFEDIDLFMPGLWELRFTVDSTDQDTGALFRFCLEG